MNETREETPTPIHKINAKVLVNYTHTESGTYIGWTPGQVKGIAVDNDGGFHYNVRFLKPVELKYLYSKVTKRLVSFPEKEVFGVSNQMEGQAKEILQAKFKSELMRERQNFELRLHKIQEQHVAEITTLRTKHESMMKDLDSVLALLNA